MKAINQGELHAQLKRLTKTRSSEKLSSLTTLLNQLSVVGYTRLVKASSKLLELQSSRSLPVTLQLALMRCSTQLGGVQASVPRRFQDLEYPHLLSQLGAILTDLEVYIVPNPETLEGLSWRLWIDVCRSLLKETRGDAESRLALILAGLSDELGQLIEVDLHALIERGSSIFARHLEPLQRAGNLATSAVAGRLSPKLRHLKERDELHLITSERVVTRRWGDCHTLRADDELLSEVEVQLGMIRVEAGSFWMSNDNGLRYPSVRLRHRVELSRPFFMAQTPVTQALYELVMGEPRRRLTYPQGAASGLSWWDCVRLCNRLSALSGLEPVYQVGRGHTPDVSLNLNASGFRLPTEAEYEYAAKAGTELTYAGSDYRHEVVNYATDVGQTKANAWGLFDLSNFVGAWCNDRWDPEAYSGRAQPCVDPLVYTEAPAQRVYRGGSSYQTVETHRVAYRSEAAPDTATHTIGCRLVRTATSLD